MHAPDGPSAPDRLQELTVRVAHLEASLEGLQDEIYRASQRHDRELAELRRAMQPENLARDLSGDARRRGL